MKRRHLLVAACALALVGLSAGATLAADPPAADPFPRPLDTYEDTGGIWETLKYRASEVPFNLVATIIFFLAIIHTFLTSRFLSIAHRFEHEHEEKIERGEADRNSVCPRSRLFHFLGEVEAVFGIWAIALVVAILVFYDWKTVIHYVGYKVNFTEPAFVVVIMTLAATRPILRLAEGIIRRIAGIFGGSLTANWLVTLTIGPKLGSFITEPAAMTICALVLARTFYELEPSSRFKYATLGLLFVNISIGGTSSHFAAPPVLMVAGPWDWGMTHMMAHFGWKATVGMLISNALYFLAFRGELAKLEEKFQVVRLKDEIQRLYLQRSKVDAEFDRAVRDFDGRDELRGEVDGAIQRIADSVREKLEKSYIPGLLEKGIDEDVVREAFSRRFEEIKLREIRRLYPGILPDERRGPFIDPDWDNRDDPVPAWVTLVHVLFMAWTIVCAHYPPLFMLGMLFFLGFAEISQSYQNRVDLRPAMLVGFFLAGLVIHGGVQGWWIAPILGSLSEVPLMVAATVLTAFNDNAAITYLATLVPDFSDALKHAVVAGAVVGGGLTIIANAPNPAGVALLKKYFDNGVSPAGLLAGSLVPTIIAFCVFLLAR